MTLPASPRALQFTEDVKHPKAQGYNIRIGSEWFRTLASREVPISIVTRDSLAQRSDDSGSIYNNVLDIGHQWGRTDLSGGEGLDWSPRELALEKGEEALDEIRYWDSSGIDISRPEQEGAQYSLRLARTFRTWDESDDPGWPDTALVDLVDLGVSRQFIYIASETSVVLFDGWDNGNPVHTAGVPSPVRAMAVSPSNVCMIACEDGNVYQMRYPLENTFTLVYGDGGNQNLAAQGVWFAAGRFIVSSYDGLDQAILFALEWNGTNNLYDNAVGIDNASGSYISVVESGPAVVAACADGTVRTYTPYNNNEDAADMSLQPRGRTTMPHGERPILLGSNAGTLLIMTTSDTTGVFSDIDTARYTLQVGDVTDDDPGAGNLEDYDPGLADPNTLRFSKTGTDGAENEFLAQISPGIPLIVSEDATPANTRTYAVTAVEDKGTYVNVITNPAENGGAAIVEPAAVTVTIGVTEPLETVRLYQAEVLDARFDYVVGQLQTRREWIGATHEQITTRNMTNTRDEMFFFVKEFFNGELRESLWRFDIITNGMSRIVQTGPYINLNGLVIFDGIGGGIDFSTDTVLITDGSELQTEGWMIFPNITFGLNTDISWIATILEAHNLEDSGGQVELWRSTDRTAILDKDHPSWVLLQRLSSQGASNTEVPILGVESRTMALQLRMYSTQGKTKTPQVTRMALRGIPRHRDLVMTVPVNTSDWVSVPGRKPTRIPGLGNQVHQRMLQLVGANVEAFLLDPFIKFSGIIDAISEPVEYETPRGSVTQYCMVQFRGQRSAATITYATGDDGTGLGLVGVSTVGIGQSEST